MRPRLARVASIAAPIGVWAASPSRPLTVVTSPTLGLTPVLLGDEKHVEVGTERTADVGEQEIDGVERERVEAVALG